MAAKTMLVTVDGWEAPVHQAMTQPPTFAGVPMGFFAADVLGSLAVAPYWWPGLVVGLLLYGIAWLGTQVEPRWLGILWQYLGYAHTYEV